MAAREHVCVDCKALPTYEEFRARVFERGHGVGPTELRPKTPRPAPHGGPRSRRCTTHWRALRKVQRAARAEKRVIKVFGLTPGEYAELLAYQGGTCAIPNCRANGTRKRLAVDHDHACCPGPESCGRCVRGLVCGPHNYELLGKYAGDLQAGLDYLASPPAARMRAARLRRTG
jgi:hypothetical protein